MTSTVLNVIFNKLLANFLEIDTSKTNISILSGRIKLENLKIKREIFEYYYIPYFELLHGYVGSLDIDLKMPFFYNNPIKVKINKIFAHFRQKDINKLKKDEELHTILEYKKNLLINSEQLFAELEEMKRQNKENNMQAKRFKRDEKAEENLPEIVQKIINNVLIDINEIVIRFDDDLSYKGIPFSMCVILNHITVRSTGKDFKLPENIDEVIPLQEMNYKVAKVEHLSAYMDLFYFEEELNFEKLIVNGYDKDIKLELKNYLKEELRFYIYCLNELKIHSLHFDSHQYLLYQLNLTTNLTLNNNTKNKKQPILYMRTDFPQILFNVTFKQIQVMLKFVAYINLNSLYQYGISSQYFNRKLSLNEKKNYVDGYEIYFRDKYINKIDVEYPESLKSMEEHITHKEIRKMRSYAMRKLEFEHKLAEIEERIKEENEKIIIIKDDNNLKKLNERKTRILKLQQNFLQNMFNDRIHNKFDILIKDDIEDSYVTLHFEFNILTTSLTIYEREERKNDGNWGFIDKVMSFSIQNLIMELKIQNIGMIFLFILENIVISDERIKNPNYNKIIFGDLTTKGRILCMILEINPKLVKSDLRIKIWSEKNLYIILNDYTFQYILTQSVNVFTTTILLEEYSLYAKDSILKYIKEGYEHQYSPSNFSHANVYLDINFDCPIIIIPIDVFDINKTQCLLFSLGKLNLKSILPPRVTLNSKIDYKKTKNENIMYDIYRIDLRNTKMSTVDNCIERNNYKGKETLILEEVNFGVDCKILIQHENPNFDNTIVDIIINDMKFKINEFQILLIIDFIKNYIQNGYRVQIDLKILKRQEQKEREKRRKERKIQDKNEKDINQGIDAKNEKMDLIPYKEKKKKADLFYKNFIKNFSSPKYHRISTEIKEIHKNKKSVLVNIVLKSVQFSLQRNYPDNSIEDYLVFQMKLLQVECDIAEDGSLIVIILVKKIFLKDYDKDEDKKRVINSEFECLIESTSEFDSDPGKKPQIVNNKNPSFIDYQLLMKGNELNNIVHVNDLHVIVSLESMIRMYQFSMYYTEIYLEKMDNAEIWRKNYIEEKAASKENKEIDEKKSDEKKAENTKENLQNYLIYLKEENNIKNIKFRLKKKSNIYKNIDAFMEFLRNKFNEIIGLERKRQIMTVLVRVNNTNVKLPLDPKKIQEPLFNMNFDLVYNQNTTYIYTDFYTFPAKRIIATFYEEIKNSMNTSVANFDLDMVYKINKENRYTRSSPEERLITNFRMACLIENFIVLNSEQNVMVIDVILEPLLLAFGMRQVRKSWILLFKVLELYPSLWVKYVPYAKPFEVNKKFKTRLSLKEMVKKVTQQQKVKKVFEKLKVNKTKSNTKRKIFNTENFNSLLITNVKSDRIGVIFFDNTNVEAKNILLDIRVKKFVCCFLQNSKITDKQNIMNTLYEILTADELSVKKYNKNTLSMYYYIFASVQANYHNIMTNKFEPLLERFETSVEMMQTAPFFRAKTNVIINDIINYNLSVDSLIALNSFILKFTEEDKTWEIKELLDPIKWRSTFAFTQDYLKNIDRRMYNLVLIFKNDSGIDLTIFFESNPNHQMKLKSDETLSFTSNTLYEARGLNKKNSRVDRNNFGVYLVNAYPIKDVSYKRTDNKQYKVNVEIRKKIIPLYFSIKIEPSYLIKNVSFSSSIAFVNETRFHQIHILIQNTNIDKYKIKIFKNSKVYIPITWLICQPPHSSILIRFTENGQMFKICDHITQLFSEPKDNKIKEKKIELDLKKKFKGNDNPKFNKIIEIENYENENMKNSRFIDINYQDENYFLNFDYFLVQSKNVKNVLESTRKRKEFLNLLNNTDLNNDNNNNNSIDELNNFPQANNQLNELLIPEINYEYVITVRHSLYIVNKLPFTLFFTYNEKNLSIETLEEKELYDYKCDQIDNYIIIKIKYFENFYSSEKINLIDIETHQYIDLKSENDKNCLKCHVIKNPRDKPIDKPKNYFIETKGYSINTYELIFFFDYLINNRLTHPLWICPCKNFKDLSKEEINFKSQQLFPTSLNVFSFPDYEYKLSIKDESSEWSQAFNINTIGVQSSIQLKCQNESSNLINEIAIIMSSSELYKFSIVIIFEPKYVFINNLGFDIVYNQENNSLNKEYLLNKSDFHSIKYEKINKHFRIGIYDKIEHMTNYSGFFNLENNEDLDLKIRINPSFSPLPQDAKIFTYDGATHYILIRIINHSYDNGTSYILFCHPLFPYLEIVNNLNAPIIITEKENGHSFIIYNNQKIKSFPFAWENPSKYKDELTFEVYGKRGTFSFSIFNEGEIKISEQMLTLAYSVSSKNKTETRSFKIEQGKILSSGDINFLQLISKSKSMTSTSYKCFIKGFGVSLINQQRKEIFYISFYNIRLKYMMNIHKLNSGTSTKTIINYILLVDNFQMDYCFNDSFRIVFNPYFQLIPSNESEVKKLLEKKGAEFVPFIAASVTTKTNKNLISNEQITSYEDITLALQKFEVKLEKDAMFNLIALSLEFMKHFDYTKFFPSKEQGQDKDKEPLLDVELPIPIKKLMKENENSVRNLINNLTLSSIKLDLTIRLDSKTFDFNIPGALKRIIGGLMNLGRITNCPLTFAPQRIQDLYISWYNLSWKIITPYIAQGAIQIFSILGSLDIIGNPANLLQNITEGVYDFVKEPGIGSKQERKGIGIGAGIVKGFGGLMSGVVGGAFNSLQRISSTVLVTIQTIMDRNKKDISDAEQNEPSNIASGFYEGIIGLGSEIGKGFYNLFTEPCKGGKTEGISGFFKGLSKGLFGLILSPVAGVFSFISSFSGGIKNSCFSIVGRKKLKTERFRHPRIIIEGEEMVHSYNERKAEAKEMLNNLNKEHTDNILYAEDFICGNTGLGKKFSTAILTDTALYVVYNSEKVIFEETLRNMKSIEIHFLDEKFIICLRLKNENSRGFKVHKDYSKVPTELFDLICAMLEKMRVSSMFSRRVSGLDRGIFSSIIQTEDDNDNIDLSSYGKTLTMNTYNSLKTIKSKIDD